MVSLDIMKQGMHSFTYRNERLKLNRISLRADLLKQQCVGLGIDFRDLMQADFLVFMRLEIQEVVHTHHWWPETLVYLGYSPSPFEIFSRSISRAYFGRARHLLGIESHKDLEPLLMSYQAGTRRVPSFAYEKIEPAELLGYAKLYTRP